MAKPPLGSGLLSVGETSQDGSDGARFFNEQSDSQSDQSINLNHVPALALGVRSRSELSKFLNPEHVTANNWKFLAEEFSYSFLEIRNYELGINPTEAILIDWSSKKGSTIGLLLEKLREIERHDVISELTGRFVSDAEKWLQKKQQEDSRLDPVQVPEVSASQAELRGITLNDNPQGPYEKFDAYVCYAPSDLGFVDELIQNLEHACRLKLCVNDRDLVPGASNATVTAELIERRCRKMLVILSPEFLQDSLCDFAVKFAVSLEPNARSKRVIPIMYRSCKIPMIMNHLTVCDFTKKDLRKWFWPRLQKALQNR